MFTRITVQQAYEENKKHTKPRKPITINIPSHSVFWNNRPKIAFNEKEEIQQLEEFNKSKCTIL